MRLVDADAMLDRFKRVFEENKEYRVADGLAMAYDMIQGQPTVDAIPISYIEELIKLSNKTGCIVYATSLEELLDDWREEE